MHPRKRKTKVDTVNRPYIMRSFTICNLDLNLLGLLLSLFMSWGETVSELRRSMGLLIIPQMIYEQGELQWNDISQKTEELGEETCPNSTLPTRNPAWTDPDLGGDRPASRSLSHERLGLRN